MSNNRHLINDSEIVRPPLVLEKGLPLPFFGKMYEVMEGWVAVMVAGGAYSETLAAGTYNLSKYPSARGLQVIQVNTRVNTLSVSTLREFTIAQPVPVEINLDVAVEYRVVDARRVALEINRPLTSLYDRVLQAMRGAVVDATVDEIRRQGEGIAQTTLRRLHAMRLPDTIGIEILQVLVTSIKATDAGSDALARMEMERLQTLEQWKTDAYMTQNSRVTWEWILLHRPEVAQQLIQQHGAIIKELVDKGLFDPAGFLNQPTNTPENNNPSDMTDESGLSLLMSGLSDLMPTQPQVSISAPSSGNILSPSIDQKPDRAPRKFGVTFAYPKLMSKRFSSIIVVKIHPQGSKKALHELAETANKHSLTIQTHPSNVEDNQTVIVKLASPQIEFSEPSLIITSRKIATVSFTGIPADNCQPGLHAAVLSITEKESGILIQSIPFQIKVVDFVFDHVSRPLLSNTTSIVLGFGSFATFALTFVGQIDQTLGLASGTAAGAIALLLYSRYIDLFKRATTNVSNLP